VWITVQMSVETFLSRGSRKREPPKRSVVNVVSLRRAGRVIYYRLADPQLRELIARGELTCNGY
jgi:hypothetical protein